MYRGRSMADSAGGLYAAPETPSKCLNGETSGVGDSTGRFTRACRLAATNEAAFNSRSPPGECELRHSTASRVVERVAIHGPSVIGLTDHGICRVDDGAVALAGSDQRRVPA